MKIEFVDIIRNNKPLLKFYNLKRNDIENQLVNESVIEKNLFSSCVSTMILMLCLLIMFFIMKLTIIVKT